MNYTLYIGNKNYSTWSMRPWVVMKYFDINFDEKLIRFDSFANDSLFKQTILPINPYGTVPVLINDDTTITDSLAICEYLAENHQNLALWPKDPKQKAIARSIVAKMHNGYLHIRNHLPMNIEASLAQIGQIILRDHLDVKNEIKFFDEQISSILAKSNGKYLFGDFSIADAFYAPMCLRLKTYQIPTSNHLNRYIETIYQTKGISDWIAEALLEKDFIPMDEPYRFNR
ncbi:glutathione S-transferase [Orbus wheelerorum]|uniref:glutathione S-transferase family protein n=1 Tax=Orbus wheelerorum TaxID=3074111 RepID=UPI00370D40AC